MAIGITLKKADKNGDPGKSKFFGDPVVPNAWAERDFGEQIFFCQINLADIAALDTENRLPRTGWLYVFLDTEVYPYKPAVYYYDGEPDTVLDAFNEFDPAFARLTQAWEMTFAPTDDEAEGIRLFGVPTDWNYAEQAPKLFMQFDPLAYPLGFMDDVDGFAYFFYGDDDDVENVRLHVERS